MSESRRSALPDGPFPLQVCGINAVAEALDSGRSLERLYVRSGYRNARIDQLSRRARQAGIPVVPVPEQKLARYGKAHQGVVAILSPVPYCSWEEVVQRAYESGEDPLLLVCDRITDVRNLGAIARTAWIAGVHGLLVPHRETAALHSEAVKASAGALLHLSVSRVASLSQAVEQMKLQGIKIAAAEARQGLLPDQVSLTGPLALIVGSEGEGIGPSLLKLAEVRLSLPMRRPFDSYNVSVAAAMLLYEVMRQRHQAAM
ncbi:MAG: 23S rRNA (guanosine(2251)-2'-O)-methyltransferase RlmB [Chitinophagales bacterium]|nr:23S rRNA (guanosine(2251)-2'-O)-methyltransferase RlmB [Chitinophagales bacterium]MDW8392652.1 23S rRNA (guanosine(2251)-2'-O)-methyltransferase RlmB [Chitinophagales bacterium]